jgi:hypothetical protein
VKVVVVLCSANCERDVVMTSKRLHGSPCAAALRNIVVPARVMARRVRRRSVSSVRLHEISPRLKPLWCYSRIEPRCWARRSMGGHHLILIDAEPDLRLPEGPDGYVNNCS